MARNEDMDRRLLNWARWVVGGGSGKMGYARQMWGPAAGGSGGYREAVIPTVDCEAEETNRAVGALPGYLRATVHEVYLRHGTDDERATRMQCGRSTIHARIGRAHALMSAWLAQLDERRRAERDRVEGLSRAV